MLCRPTGRSYHLWDCGWPWPHDNPPRWRRRKPGVKPLVGDQLQARVSYGAEQPPCCYWKSQGFVQKKRGGGRGNTAALIVLKPKHKIGLCWDFPGGPVAKTPCSRCRGPRFDPWSENYIPHAATKSSHAATKDPKCHNQRSHMLQGRSHTQQQ